MTALPTLETSRTELGAAVVAHLDEQLASARRLLDAVLRQGAHTRRQDVEGVLGCLTEVQGEMERRGRLEEQRGAILAHAAARLGRAAHEISLEAMSSLMTPAEATTTHERSAELRGLLGEVQREHHVNRALMRQELAFLDHLVRLFAAEEDAGYRPPAETAMGISRPTPPAQRHRVLDLRA